MADTKISQLATLAAANIAAGDWIPVVDVSDTSMAATGTTKKFDLGDVATKAPGTWTPVITASTGNPTVTYTLQEGKVYYLSELVFYRGLIQINTISGGSGNLQLSLPTTVPAGAVNGVVGNISVSGVDFAGTPMDLVFVPTAGAATGNILVANDNAAATLLAVTGLAAGDVITYQGWYFAT